MSTTLERIEITDEEAVATEADRLDRLFPGWAERVNIDTLNLWSSRDCVLGQATRDYDTAVTRVFSDGYRDQPYGGLFADDDRFKPLWVNEIRKRTNQ